MIVNGMNLSMTRGDDESFAVSCPEYKFQQGDKVTFTVRRTTMGRIAIQKTVTDFHDGKANFSINHDDTDGLMFGVYVYDVQLEMSDGTVKTIIKPPEQEGNFKILKEVTY